MIYCGLKMNTLGKTIVMGRKTWQSLGKKLKTGQTLY